MIEIEKLGTNYYVVGCMHFFEEFIFLLKVRPVSSAQDHFLMWFLDSPPEKVQRCKFSWRLALQNSSYNNLIRYRKFKMADFWKKKALKLPNFQYLRNRLELGEKILLTFVSY